MCSTVCGFGGYAHIKSPTFKSHLWILSTPSESHFRHWKFSIWSTNKGVMTIFVEGYNSKNEKKHMLLGWSNYYDIFGFFWLYPSTKMAITPLLVDQIEKFQCLELSTAPKLSSGNFRSHVACVTCPEMWLEVSELYKWINSKFPNKWFQNH